MAKKIWYGTVNLSTLNDRILLEGFENLIDMKCEYVDSAQGEYFVDRLNAGEPITNVTRVRLVYKRDTGRHFWEILSNKAEFYGVLKAIQERRVGGSVERWMAELPIYEVTE